MPSGTISEATIWKYYSNNGDIKYEPKNRLGMGTCVAECPEKGYAILRKYCNETPKNTDPDLCIKCPLEYEECQFSYYEHYVNFHSKLLSSLLEVKDDKCSEGYEVSGTKCVKLLCYD